MNNFNRRQKIDEKSIVFTLRLILIKASWLWTRYRGGGGEMFLFHSHRLASNTLTQDATSVVIDASTTILAYGSEMLTQKKRKKRRISAAAVCVAGGGGAGAVGRSSNCKFPLSSISMAPSMLLKSVYPALLLPLLQPPKANFSTTWPLTLEQQQT